MASQEVIKKMGTNGGGFFNANSAHPFENPNPFTNCLEIYLLLLIAFALPRTFGKMVGQPAGLRDRRGHGRSSGWPRRRISFFEAHTHWGTATMAAGHAAEGNEVRFGTPACAVFAASTTLTSTGAVNCFHDSLTPFGGGIALFDMMLGEIAPGGTAPACTASWSWRSSRCSSPG